MKFITKTVLAETAVKSFVGIKAPNSAGVDIGKFAAGIGEACNQLDTDGYDLVQIIPVTVGTEVAAKADPVGITRGAVVLGRRRE